MTRDELLTELLVERYGVPVPQHHPRPLEEDTTAVTWLRLRELHDAITDDVEATA